MDPAETDNIKRALANQGALVTKHETTLRQVVDNLQQLATGITDLGGRMDAITGQLTALAHAPPPPPAPVPPPAVAPVVAPREPFIPTPASHPSGIRPFHHYLII
ncbi:LOW QUALITY PROTEIN: regulating synaptic membrane exocytosis protein 2-like [Scomber scombrus]|uniref:LOW QUALITY PROTEIN: regulating synaptic membrane exocytosis protein 2-like n=1 Tax=Scomber scombrus TaxID=13677 RepID=A0AAV1PGI4_SCOSC